MEILQLEQRSEGFPGVSSACSCTPLGSYSIRTCRTSGLPFEDGFTAFPDLANRVARHRRNSRQ